MLYSDSAISTSHPYNVQSKSPKRNKAITFSVMSDHLHGPPDGLAGGHLLNIITPTATGASGASEAASPQFDKGGEKDSTSPSCRDIPLLSIPEGAAEIAEVGDLSPKDFRRTHVGVSGGGDVLDTISDISCNSEDSGEPCSTVNYAKPSEDESADSDHHHYHADPSATLMGKWWIPSSGESGTAVFSDAGDSKLVTNRAVGRDVLGSKGQEREENLTSWLEAHSRSGAPRSPVRGKISPVLNEATLEISNEVAAASQLTRGVQTAAATESSRASSGSQPLPLAPHTSAVRSGSAHSTPYRSLPPQPFPLVPNASSNGAAQSETARSLWRIPTPLTGNSSSNDCRVAAGPHPYNAGGRSASSPTSPLRPYAGNGRSPPQRRPSSPYVTTAAMEKGREQQRAASYDISLASEYLPVTSSGPRGCRPPPSPARCPSPNLFSIPTQPPPLAGSVGVSAASSARSSSADGRGRSPRGDVFRDTVWVSLQDGGTPPYVPTHLEQHRRTTPRRLSEVEDDEVNTWAVKPPTPTASSYSSRHGKGAALSMGASLTSARSGSGGYLAPPTTLSSAPPLLPATSSGRRQAPQSDNASHGTGSVCEMEKSAETKTVQTGGEEADFVLSSSSSSGSSFASINSSPLGMQDITGLGKVSPPPAPVERQVERTPPQAYKKDDERTPSAPPLTASVALSIENGTTATGKSTLSGSAAHTGQNSVLDQLTLSGATSSSSTDNMSIELLREAVERAKRRQGTSP